MRKGVVNLGDSHIDIEKRNMMVEENKRLAYYLAGRFQNWPDSKDLSQEAIVGLIMAADRYDSSRGQKFSTFAHDHIMGGMKHYLRDKARIIRIPGPVQAVIRRIEKAINGMLIRGQKPDFIALVAELGLSEEKVAWAIRSALLRGQSIVDQMFPNTDKCRITFIDDVKDDHSTFIEYIELIDVRRAVLCLRSGCREIVRWRFTSDLLQREIGNRLGVSPTQANRYLEEILGCLRQIMIGMESGEFAPGDSMERFCFQCGCRSSLNQDKIKARRMKKT